MTSKRNIVKRKDIPLTIVKSAKRCKIKHIKAKVKSTGLDLSNESLVGRLNDEALANWLDDDYTFEETTDDEADVQQPSCHTKRKEKAAERWKFVQSVAMNTVIMTMAKPQLSCAVCIESAGIVKCYQCGPQKYYCVSCATKIHQNSLFHHYMEIWQVNTYVHTYMYQNYTTHFVILIF